METRSKNYMRNTFWGILTKIIMIVLPFIVRSILIYTLGVEYVGLGTLFSTILQVLSLAELGFGAALVCSMYKPIAENNKQELCALLKMYRRVYKIIGLLILCVGLIILPFLSFFIKETVPDNINIYILYILYLINTVSSYFLFAYRSSLLSAHQRNDIKSKINLVINIIYYILQIIMLLTCKNYYIYILLMPIATIVNNLYAGYKSKKMYPEIYCAGEVDEKTKNKIKIQVKSLIWHKIGNTIIFSFDNIVISMFLGLTILGIYNNYYFIFNSVASLFSVFYESITPGIGNSIVTCSKEKNYNDYKDFCVLNFAITSICACLLVSLYQPFMLLWQGEKLMLGDSIPFLLCSLFIVWHSRRMLHTYKDACGLWKVDKYRPMIEAIVNLLINIILVNIIGLKGIVISTIVSMLFVGIPWEINKFIKGYFNEKLKNYYYFLVKNLFKVCLTVIITYFISTFIPNGSILLFTIKTFIVFVISIMLLIFFYYKNSSIKRVLLSIKRSAKNV